MPVMATRFGCKVGLSDHTLGIGVAVAATALGASVIEKHVTLARADGGVDAAFSVEPHELRQLVEECDTAARALGAPDVWSVAAEAESLRLRPSLYVSVDAKAGDVATAINVRSVRPAGGLPPADLPHVLGRTFSRDVRIGTPVSWDLFSS
jgi:N-acetylneuraminate synthase